VGSSLIGVKKNFWHWYACVTHARYDPAIAASAKPSSKLKKGKKYQRTKNKKKTLLPKINITTKNDDIIDLDDKITKTTI